ncbi:MAG: transcription-repair coupling factor [Verrucomicrobiaceae bacterium]|nr:transcription-repair coupling factor [Verrucomicrobiaceae bacterium]
MSPTAAASSITSPLTATVQPKPGDRQRWSQLRGSAMSLAVASAARELQQPVVWVTRDTAAARRAEQELRFFADELDILHLPDWETLPYDTFSPHQDIISERLTTLYHLPETKRGVLVVPVSTLLHRLPPPSYLLANSLMIDKGQQLDVEQLRERLASAGYRSVTTVYEHGEFAQRGSLFDIFPMGSTQPFRIDLLDDEVDSLRTFDPETQRTTDQVEQIRLLPGREFPLTPAAIKAFRERWHETFDVDHRRCTVYQDVSQGIAPAGIEYYLPLFFGDCASLFDYLPAHTVIFADQGIENTAQSFWSEASDRYEQRRHNLERPILAPARIFEPVDQLFARFKTHQQITLSEADGEAGSGQTVFATLTPPPLAIDAKAEDPIAALRRFASSDQRVLLCAESAGRRETLLDLLARNHLKPKAVDNWHAFATGKQTLAITVAPIDRGLQLPEQHLALVTESQLFGQRVLQTRRRKRQSEIAENAVRNLSELRIGAAVVHIDHGVGRYAGLQTLAVDGQEAEFVTLEYAEGAKLYVPVASLHLIGRYSGGDPELAPLHRLGNDHWQKAKRKAAEQIRDVAAELLDIYARRAARPGQAFDDPGHAYDAFAAGFPFEETPDQQSAIAAVLEDMQASTAMDRLVCGDVGFGKTEVAMRAAFIAVHNGTQVSILVPTTLLAQQHFESFKDRFADWPVTIEVLSRFRSAADQQRVLERLAEGKVDILIGTHKLLQDDVKYHNLGLLVIDEEHRFGVRQKEKLKSFRAQVDILTLTATPIPRTLNMAMSGMRDLSIIATPPARRLSVKTFVRRYDNPLIKEAIQREILRGGQVYFLHNDVKTIEKTAKDLLAMLPELRVGIGHGQMRERDLEQVMSDFYHKRHNVLVCSTIIETGIDVPNANTIIIERADKFGLAQLHQLRGRVGRSHHQAYAYLLTGAETQLTPDAEKRLEAISMAEDLGAGFTLATHDLEIRGAGELLGEEQSGQIHTIGFTLYMEMLERAVKAIKAGKTPNIDEPLDHGAEVNLRLPALIPEDYLPDVQARLILYKRIANTSDEDGLRELQVEMIDRFGLLPDQLKNLIRVTALKQQAQVLGIRKIEAGANGGKLEFEAQPNVEPLTLIKMVQSKPGTYRLAGAAALSFTADLEENEQRFQFVEKLISALTPANAEKRRA